MGEDLGRQPSRKRARHRAPRERFDDRRVVVGIADRQHVVAVLGRGAQQRRPADVDLLDQLGARDSIASRRRLEGVEVDHHHVDEVHVEPRGLVEMLRLAAVGQHSRVHERVQRLHASVQAFGKPGDVAHLGHPHSRLAQPRRGAAGGDHLHPGRGQRRPEFGETGLVVDADRARGGR